MTLPVGLVLAVVVGAWGVGLVTPGSSEASSDAPSSVGPVWWGNDAAGDTAGEDGGAVVLSPEAAGALDPTFGGDGRVQTNITSRDDFATELVIQPDGKVVIAGGIGGGGGQFGVARFNPDGTLDSSFSGDGWTATNFTRRGDQAYDVALQSDGKIVAAGHVGGQGGRFGVARYRPNGTLDPSFSGDGKVFTNFSDRFDGATGLVIQPDGKIVAAGEAGSPGGRFAVARYNPNGTLDTSFSADGKNATNFTAGSDYAWDLALQSNGALVAAGVARGGTSQATIGLARYRPNGTLDPTFSSDGTRLISLGPRVEAAGAVQVQPDGKIVIGGEYGGEGRLRFAAARLIPNGAFDASFSGDGRAAVDFNPNAADWVTDLVVQADGAIALAGYLDTLGGQFAVARLLSSGVLDSSFGNGDGRVTTDFTRRFDMAGGIDTQADGRLVAAGGSLGDTGNARIALARYDAS